MTPLQQMIAQLRETKLLYETGNALDQRFQSELLNNQNLLDPSISSKFESLNRTVHEIHTLHLEVIKASFQKDEYIQQVISLNMPPSEQVSVLLEILTGFM